MLYMNNIDQISIKQSNTTKILRLIYEKKEITKQKIASLLGLSIPTVINNVNLLIEEGLLEESGVAVSTGGRKPVIIRFVEDSRYSFGVEISPEEVRIILTNLYLEIKSEYSLRNVNLEDVNEVIDRIKQTIDRIIEEYNISNKNILGIGFSLPGIVDEKSLYLENAPNLKIKDIDFKAFEEKLGFPISIENDANAAALAESVIGTAKSKSNLVYIEITEGIGAGIIINGCLYKGQNKKAGEIGHIRISTENLRCNCGKAGCWELYASERALLKSYNNKADHNVEGLEELFQKYSNNDKLTKDIVDKYLDYLAIGIQNIILAFAPEYVIIGGKISSYENILLESLKRKIMLENSILDTYNTQVIFSKLKENASILGAALLPLSKLFE